MKPLPPLQQNWLRSMEEGQLRFSQARLGEAIEAFTRATQISSLRAESWCNLGIVQVESGQHQSALISLQKSIALQPRLMAAHIALGDALRHLGRFSEGTRAYREAVALQRTPISLNRLACSLRSESRPAEAEALYREAIQIEPGFTIAQVNLATVQIELKQFDQASQQLQKLKKVSLPIAEHREVESAQRALSVYQRTAPALSLLEQGEPEALLTVLEATPEHLLEVDEGILNTIGRYAESANELPQPLVPEDEAIELPGEWAMIEALFMIPIVENVLEYRKTIAALATGKKKTRDLLESVNMESLVSAVRAARADMNDPIKAELHLRHWHVLATSGVPGFSPGHFKITHNLVQINPSRRRAEPHLVCGTLRRFISEIYSSVTPGLPRAIIAWMAICDIHPFADGNGRIGMAWLNRELEWAGGMPTLFSRELGIAGRMGAAMSEVRRSGDVSVLVPAINEAQRNAREFCLELAGR